MIEYSKLELWIVIVMDMNDRPIVSSHSIRPIVLLFSCIWPAETTAPVCRPPSFLHHRIIHKRTTILGRGHPKNGARWRSNYNYNYTPAVLRAVRSRSSAEPGTETETAKNRDSLCPIFDGLYS
jgi:hypothetical protein